MSQESRCLAICAHESCAHYSVMCTWFTLYHDLCTWDSICFIVTNELCAHIARQCLWTSHFKIIKTLERHYALLSREYRMSHVTYRMSHVTCRMSHVTSEIFVTRVICTYRETMWVMYRMRESFCHVVSRYVHTTHVHMNESCTHDSRCLAICARDSLSASSWHTSHVHMSRETWHDSFVTKERIRCPYLHENISLNCMHYFLTLTYL